MAVKRMVVPRTPSWMGDRTPRWPRQQKALDNMAKARVTALVHDAYLRLVDYREPRFKSRKHFYVVAAHVMRAFWSIMRGGVMRKNGARRCRLTPAWWCGRMSTCWTSTRR